MSHPKNQGLPCVVAECPNEAKRGGFCWAHVKRRQRELALAKPLRERSGSAWHGLMHAVFALADTADAPTDPGVDARRVWRRAVWRFRDAMRRYLKAKRGVRIPYGELWKIARARAKAGKS